MKLRSQAPPAGVVSAVEKALHADEADVAEQLARIESVAVYVGRKGTADQKAAIVQALENVADDAAPAVVATARKALGAIQQSGGKGE
jgi:hypothetical protein